jgi:hypothetical protein
VKLRNQQSLAQGKKNILLTWSLSNFPLSVPASIASTMSYSMPTKTEKKNHKIKKSILFKETQNSTSAAIDSLIVILQIEFMTSTSHHPSSTGMPRHCTLAESSTGHFRSVANEFEIETNTQRQECG